MNRALSARIAAPLAALAVLAVGALAWPFTIDDAFITARYAQRLASGRGLTFIGSDAHAVSDGVTSPLWLLPGVIAQRLGTSPLGMGRLGMGPIDAQKLLGLALMALAAALIVSRARRRQGGTRAAWMAALLVASGPTLGVWGVAGLETGAATLALTAVVLGATARPRVDAVLVGVCVGLLAWLRPEALPAGVVALITVGIGGGRRAALTSALIAASLVVGVAAYRVVLFGHLLPLAAQAKPAELSAGLAYVARAALVTTGVAGLALAALAARQGRRGDGWACAIVATYLASVAVAGGDWMPGFRLVAPCLPSLALLASVGASRALLRSRTRAARIATLAAVALAALVPLVDLGVQLPEVRAAGQTRAEVARPLARWLALRARNVALVDIGYLAYVGGFDVVDLGGVTDQQVAQTPGGHLDKALDPAWLAERAPDAIVLHASTAPRVSATGELLSLAGYPIERRVAAMPWVRAHFRVARIVEYAPGYVYVVMLPRR